MSGTSLDGVDGVLVDFEPIRPRVLQHVHTAFPASFSADLLSLNQSGPDELHRAALAGNALSRLYANNVQQLLTQAQAKASDVAAIGAHGQTVRHRPQEFDGTGYTLQINNPSLLAELTGIDVVADFRSRDVAAGGQGAPLVPIFHQALFGEPGKTVCVLNIGGISNLSVLRDNAILGFDCGPGNALMDGWCSWHTGQAFDESGRWAASATIHEALLRDLATDPYFELAPPKSTGRDLFNMDWLNAHLARFSGLSPADVQATLTELTALICARDITRHGAGCHRLAVCGGGALNAHLIQRIQAHLPSVHVTSTEASGLPPLQVEACAFAWLARQTVERKTASLQSVTGARGARVLGGIYPAHAGG
jgi:anhydro-N-acetylmuramic acid kinase